MTFDDNSWYEVNDGSVRFWTDIFALSFSPYLAIVIVVIAAVTFDNDDDIAMHDRSF